MSDESSGEDAFTERELTLATGKISALDGGSGPPVVFLHHSWGSAGWQPVHTKLAQSHRVIIPDMPGWGASERPAWARDPRDIAILVGRVLDHMEVGPATVVGCGFGGYVACELATISPARLSALVLIGAAGLQPDEGEIADQMLMSHHQYVEDSYRDKETFIAQLGEEPPDEVRELWDHSREMTARVTWKPYMFNRRLAPLLADVPTPALVVWGESDRIIPIAAARQFEAALPNAQLEIVPAAGHLVELEEPDKIAALVADLVNKTS